MSSVNTAARCQQKAKAASAVTEQCTPDESPKDPNVKAWSSDGAVESTAAFKG